MFHATPSPYLVPFDGSFSVADSPTKPPDDAPGKDECREILDGLTDRLADLQRVLYAHDHYAVLLVFQAMDAGGKDGTIRAVLRGVNPAGCQVFSFKAPSSLELDHDFLWRTSCRLPERGRIGVFNRSYYEEVLVVRVHPSLLKAQRLPESVNLSSLWSLRYDSIRDHEKHLARNGTVVLKFWLNVSREEQRERFLARLDKPNKHWKFRAGDVEERQYWASYMRAYEESLSATSRTWAPWYAIPADNKPFMRMTVARIIVNSLESLGLSYPEPTESERRAFAGMRQALEKD